MLYRELVESHREDERIVLHVDNVGLSYQQIDCLVMNALINMEKEGLLRGDRVLIVGSNNLETVLLILACIAGGYVFVPIDAGISIEKYRMIIQNCMPKVIYIASEEAVRESVPGIRMITVSRIKGEYFKFDKKEKDREKRLEIDADGMAYILYTSGSTSEPKGVVACYRQVIFCIEAINRVLENGKDDRILSVLPVAFDYGLYQIFLALSSGAVLYLKDHYMVQELPGELMRLGISGFPGLPSMFRLLIRTRLFERMESPALRYITSTGEVFSERLIRQLERIFPTVHILPMYGLTECKRVSMMPLNKETQQLKKGSCGVPLSGIRVWLRDKDENTGIGELVVSGPNVMEGYWNDKAETERYFVLSKEQDSNTLYTGDLFSIDSDGFLYFKGRKKRILKVRGHRISCSEIEAFAEEIEGVEECVVFGYLSKNDEEKAGICAVSDNVKSGNRKMADVIRHEVEVQYPMLKGFSLWMRTESLPRNIHGKIDVIRVQRECEDYGK
ncbi:class I adenylate-forming enzyme family protein [Bariatricus sp. SGI.154]|uniref:class I adenylate-forming enzyme family protein n=1 Tax=Bariatricus sp. SGI.154 TaxID=3420549 RepID=UPI003D0780F8